MAAVVMHRTESGSPVSLTLARSWYALVGAGALALTAGGILSAMSPGAVVDVPNLGAGLAVGVLTLAAAILVRASGGPWTALAWVGIVVGILPFAWLLWVAVTTAAPDAIALAAVPTALAVLAAIRLAFARARAADGPSDRARSAHPSGSGSGSA